MLRTGRTFSKPRAAEEIWNGVSQLFTLQRLLDEGTESLCKNFRRIRKSLLDSGCVIHITADDVSAAHTEVTRFIEKTGLSAPKARIHTDLADFLPLTVYAGQDGAAALRAAHSPGLIEVCAAPSQVGFASLACESSPYGSTESARESVFAHWFSNTMLWEQIRTVGGAYGVFAFPDSFERIFTMATYRDPNPRQSLDTFVSCLEKACRIRLDKETVERAICGAYSKEVQPRSPSGRGFSGFVRKLYGITDEMREKKIAGMLAVTSADINNAAESLMSALKKNSTRSIVGNIPESPEAIKIILPF
jgi:Zn-dependent M16 (insulinase) family peptidase